MILIGSRALKLRAPYLLQREPKDFDWVCSQEEFDQWLENHSKDLNIVDVYSPKKHKMIVRGSSVNCEFVIITPGSSSELMLELVKDDSDTIESEFGLVPSLDLLFTIKSSHKYRKNSPHFWKTLSDYHLMKMVGAKVQPRFNEFLKLREQETYTNRHPRLNTSKRNFFNENQVSYKYDHDSLHEAVKHFERPAYSYFQKDGAEVACDKKKFFSSSREVQLFSVVEESAVLALERSLIPYPNKWTHEFAWRFAFSKVCTSIASGWWREFAYENAMDCLKLYPTDYWNKFQQGLVNGIVKPFKN